MPFSYNQMKYTSNLLLDLPLFYSINKSVNDFTLNPLENIIIIGVNLRYEASVLNTRIRREIKQRGTTYVSLGNFNRLSYSQKHKGNSYRAIIAFIENRITIVKTFNEKSNKTAIYIGANSLRNNSSPFIQQYIRQIAKYLFSQNGKNDRLGYIHSSIGSLSFAHINRANNVIKNKSTKSLCYIDMNSENLVKGNQSNLMVFSTHFKNERNHFAIPSFYESTGHVFSIESNVRKHNKVVTTSPKVYTVATLLNYTITKYMPIYYS